MYDPENLKKALEAVYSHQMTQVKAAKKFGVPQATISRRLAKYTAEKMNS